MAHFPTARGLSDEGSLRQALSVVLHVLHRLILSHSGINRGNTKGRLARKQIRLLVDQLRGAQEVLPRFHGQLS